jgi:hypothetical protein
MINHTIALGACDVVALRSPEMACVTPEKLAELRSAQLRCTTSPEPATCAYYAARIICEGRTPYE